MPKRKPPAAKPKPDRGGEKDDVTATAYRFGAAVILMYPWPKPVDGVCKEVLTPREARTLADELMRAAAMADSTPETGTNGGWTRVLPK